VILYAAPFAVDKRVGDVRGRGHAQRVTIRRGLGDQAAAIMLFAPGRFSTMTDCDSDFGELGCKRARQGIASTARREAHQYSDWFVGIRLPDRRSDSDAQEEECDKSTELNLHDASSSLRSRRAANIDEHAPVSCRLGERRRGQLILDRGHYPCKRADSTTSTMWKSGDSPPPCSRVCRRQAKPPHEATIELQPYRHAEHRAVHGTAQADFVATAARLAAHRSRGAKRHRPFHSTPHRSVSYAGTPCQLREQDRHYVPGPGLFEIGLSLPPSYAHFVEACGPTLSRISRQTEGVTYLMVRSNAESVCIARKGFPNTKALTIDVGSRGRSC